MAIATPARAPLLLSAAAAALLAAQAVAYVAHVSNPLIAWDNWVFVETFLRVAVEQGAGLGDYLVKRAGVDHAQPLGKLLMLWNLHLFGLDFRFEGYLGMVFGAIGCALLFGVVLCDREAPPDAAVCAALVAIAAVHFSIDSLNVYLYAMVTMWHVLLAGVVAVGWLSWRALRRSGAAPLLALAAMASVWGVIADDTAILGTAALLGALFVWAWRSGQWRPALRVAAVLVAVLLACRGLFAAFGEIRGTTHPEFNVDAGARIAALAGMWREAWLWIETPLASGLLHRDSAQALAGDASAPLRSLAAGLLLVAHVAFWRSAARGRTGLAWFVAIMLMLYFYAHVAGLLYGRVFARGAVFLDQSRYVVFYRIGILALLVMLAARLPVRAPAPRRAMAWATMVALLALQWPLSVLAWRHAEGLPAHFARMAADMARLAADPDAVVHCRHGIDPCAHAPAERARLMRFLVERQVNLFSPAFQRRHPELAEAAGIDAGR